MEKNIAWCPNCGGEIRFKKVPFLGQDVTCRHCNIKLVVVEKTPVELDWAEYDDDEYTEYEDEFDEEDSHSHLSRN